MVGVWNHEDNREDTGLIIDVKTIKNKYNNQFDKKYLVMIDKNIYELFSFQIFEPGKAVRNNSAKSMKNSFFSKQGKYERISLDKFYDKLSTELK